MEEFVFGTVATLERRVGRLQAQAQGVWHRNQLRPRTPLPLDHPTITITTQLPVRVSRVTCFITAPQPYSIDLECVDTQWDLLNWSYTQVWQTTLRPQPEGTIVRYHLMAYPVQGDPIPADKGERFSYRVGDFTPPDWAGAAIVYQIFPDRFSPGRGRNWNPVESLSDIYGGTLRGIIDHLDYIADLGFNAIWLNPIFPDTTHHGYHASDYFSVNPRLGTLDDLKELIHKGRERGIRFILDFVANHWGSDHPTFRSALADKDSPYHDWYTWQQWPYEYETFFGVRELPQINTSNPDARAHLLQSMQFWLELGFDGLRLDYAIGPRHDFWTDFAAAALQANPNVWIFGEAVEPPDVQLSYAGRFHGCLDFLLAQMLRSTFAMETRDLVALDAFLHQHDAFFPDSFSRPSFLDNHDLDRFLFLAQGDKRKLKLAALCQFTLPGVPIVYNGTEVGISQGRQIHGPGGWGMEACREPMRWGDEQDADLRDYFRGLIQLRRAHPAIWQGERRTLHVTPDTWVYAIADENEQMVVALNRCGREQTITLDDPSHIFTLPPYSGNVLIKNLR